jgi:hypothetical protein
MARGMVMVLTPVETLEVTNVLVASCGVFCSIVEHIIFPFVCLL